MHIMFETIIGNLDKIIKQSRENYDFIRDDCSAMKEGIRDINKDTPIEELKFISESIISRVEGLKGQSKRNHNQFTYECNNLKDGVKELINKWCK